MKNRISVSMLTLGLALLASAGSGWATTSVLNSTVDALSVTGYSNTGTGGALQTKTLTWYSGSGYGVNSGGETSPQHSLDNVGYKEALLLNFGASTQLNSVKIGWKYNDADITVLAWKPLDYMNPAISNVTGPTFGASTKYSDLIGLGWSLVGNYSNLVTTSEKSVNVTSPVSSSFWLVMAYNSAFSGQQASDVSARGFVADTSPDYGKFYSVSYSSGTKTQTEVSEPSTALLLGAAMFGFVGWRSRKRAA
ncbi:exosortase-dependent surface protein XDP1 [Dechloromonas sp. A34]|uniref:exosortase-dependent surface protein XDP1 n=1 Tax=Dechloromonas sp. A34 TaxID=447588 RepID=UPI002249345C|nr:exosortase-dependent surface protein XDP1 [Dechloromonas sp. A34]